MKWICLFVFIWISTTVVDANASCEGNEEAQRFSVVVAKPGPLGLRLNDGLQVMEFISDANGQSRTVEASQMVMLRDRIVQVNDQSLHDASLNEAINVLTEATIPKTIYFMPYDERCAKESPQISNSLEYMVLSDGVVSRDESFYALMSTMAPIPPCGFRDIVVANPLDACFPIDNNATDKYVVVPAMSGCPPHQKAAFVQEAGASGIILVQRSGLELQQVLIPSHLPLKIDIPIVMITMDSGTTLFTRLQQSSSKIARNQLRMVFSESCFASEYTTHPDTGVEKTSSIFATQEAVAGLLAIFKSRLDDSKGSSLSYEFLRPSSLDLTRQTAPTLPLGKNSMIVFPKKLSKPLCTTKDMKSYASVLESSQSNQASASSFLMLYLQSGCSLSTQVELFAAHGMQGVIFVDPNFPHMASPWTSALLAEKSSIPIAFISSTSFDHIRGQLGPSASRDVVRGYVEFNPKNALLHQWKDVASLSNMDNWPMTPRGRKRLLHRMMKEQAQLKERDNVDVGERRQALMAAYHQVELYHNLKT